ncbi:thermonuclease family protein [Solidesulfovibrio sp.]
MLRRVAILPLCCLLLAAAMTPAAARGRVFVESVSAVVDHVYDGDTLTVIVPGWPAVVSSIQVRVYGIGTAEIHDPCPEIQALGLLARDWLAAHLRPGDAVTLRNVRRDKSPWLLADIEAVVDGEARDVASELVRRGLARPYDGQGPKPW